MKKDCCVDECQPSCSCSCGKGSSSDKVEKVVDDLKKDTEIKKMHEET